MNYLKNEFPSGKLERAVEKITVITDRNIVKFQNRFPYECTVKGRYPFAVALDNNGWIRWTNGFWGGIVWLLYEIRRDAATRYFGQKLTHFINEMLNKKIFSYSDIGFFTIPCCISDFRETQNSAARETIVTAADSLLVKYDPHLGFICSDEKELAQDLLTCNTSNLLNTQLLFHAYTFTKNTEYIDIAKKNIEKIVKDNIPDNGISCFRSYYNRKTGEKLDPEKSSMFFNNGRIISPRSCAWALYGLAVRYSCTKEQSYADRFDAVFNYLVSKKIEDKLYTTFFCGKNIFPDSTSSAIIAAALTEMLKNNEMRKDKYKNECIRLLNLLVDKNSCDPSTNNEGLIKNGFLYTVSKESCSTILGDYFYFETLVNILTDRQSVWY